MLGKARLSGIDDASHVAWCGVNNLIGIGTKENGSVNVKIIEPRHLEAHTDLQVSEGEGASLVSLAWSFPRQSRALLTALDTGEVLVWTQDAMDAQAVRARTVDQWYGRQDLHHWVRQSQLTFAAVTRSGDLHLWWSTLGKLNGSIQWETSGPLPPHHQQHHNLQLCLDPVHTQQQQRQRQQQHWTRCKPVCGGLATDLNLSYDGSQLAVSLLGQDGGAVVLDAHSLEPLQEFAPNGTSQFCNKPSIRAAAEPTDVAEAAVEASGQDTAGPSGGDAAAAAGAATDAAAAAAAAVLGRVAAGQALAPAVAGQGTPLAQHQPAPAQAHVGHENRSSFSHATHASSPPATPRSLTCFSGNTCVLCQVVVCTAGHTTGSTQGGSIQPLVGLQLHTLSDILPSAQHKRLVSEASPPAAVAAPATAVAAAASAAAAGLVAQKSHASETHSLITDPGPADPTGHRPAVEISAQSASLAPGAVLSGTGSKVRIHEILGSRPLDPAEDERSLETMMMATADASRLAWALHHSNSTWDVSQRMKLLSDRSSGRSMAHSLAVLDQMLESTSHDVKPDWGPLLDRVKVDLLGDLDDPSAIAVAADACMRTRLIHMFTILEVPKTVTKKDTAAWRHHHGEVQTVALFCARIVMLLLSCIKAWGRCAGQVTQQPWSSQLLCPALLADANFINRLHVALHNSMNSVSSTTLKPQQHSVGHLTLPWLPALLQKDGCRASVHHRLFLGRFRLHYIRPCAPFSLTSVAAMLQLPCMTCVPLLPLEQLMGACAAMGMGGAVAEESLWSEAVLSQARGFRLPSPTVDAPFLPWSQPCGAGLVREWKRQRTGALGLQPYGESGQLRLAGPMHDCLTGNQIEVGQGWTIESVDGKWVTAEFGDDGTGSSNGDAPSGEGASKAGQLAPSAVTSTTAWLRKAWACSAPMTGVRWRRIKRLPPDDLFH
ncbi:MAG: hypothetical protein WDW38_008341 [Sanguina aurantia]